MSEKKRMINSDLEDRMTLDWQGTRAFFYGMGYNDADIEKPRVGRSEERRVGKECLRMCRSRWSPYH